MSYQEDVALAIRRVFQLGQTYWQQADSESYRENDKSDVTLEKYRATLAEPSEIAARADARIAELERECSQWRDELRIYRETENKRIAELEQAVTVRDTEVAGLETDLELARRDVERYRWLRDESGNDHHTPWCAVGYSDPTWLTGEHLDAAIDAARAGNGGGV